MNDIELNIKSAIKDLTIEGLIEIIKNLSTEIDKYYITRKEHNEIVEKLKEEKWHKKELRF